MFQESITKEELEELPLKSFEGEIIVVEDQSVLKDSVAYLKKCKIIGFDTETKPSFKKGVSNSVCLLQLSTEDKAFLFRIHKTGLPESLRDILSDPEILKVGVAIRDDIKGLQKIEPFKDGGFIELQTEVKDFGINDMSLKKLAGITMGIRVSKMQRLSNWEAEKLSRAQQIYAATDAWVSYMILYYLIKEI